MARYDDPAVLYDMPGICYDAASASPERKRMAKVRTGGSKMSLAELIAAVRNVITQMTGNADFTTPNPTLVALGAAADDAEAKAAAVLAKKAETDQALLDRDNSQTALLSAFEQEAAYVQNQSGGDEAKILSTGYGVRGTTAAIGPVAQVLNLAVTEGDNPGSVDEQHDPVRGANSYEVAIYAGDNPANGVYTQAATPTASNATLTGLTSGSRVWVKARAPWSARPSRLPSFPVPWQASRLPYNNRKEIR